MTIRAKYWLGTNIDYNLTSISSSFLSSFPSSFTKLRTFQSESDLCPGWALRRWIDSKSNTDRLDVSVRLSVSSNGVGGQSTRGRLCSKRGDSSISAGIGSSIAAGTVELADGHI
jgi:hypothetical protein